MQLKLQNCFASQLLIAYFKGYATVISDTLIRS